MPEHGQLDSGAAGALPGTAPRERESGKWIGQERVQGGRANVQQVLYMPALVAALFNPDLKQKYDVPIAAGLPLKVALLAIMRKLDILANALLKDDQKWTPNIA